MSVKTINIDQPITQGDNVFVAVDLRKPTAGELRGLSLADLLRMEVAALETVIPRIATPTLTKQDVAKMDPADLMQCAVAVADFLLQKAQKPDFLTE
jgi:hypothetical protein